MTQLTDHNTVEASPATDLVTAICQVLRNSPEPLTVSKIKAQLPAPFRHASPEELSETLHRQVTANVLQQYPKYRSQQERFWDRPMPEHVTNLLRAALEAGPLSSSELRRRLPVYAQERAETVLVEEIAKGAMHRHPRSGRVGERFGLQPADAKDYLRSELSAVFERLQVLGFSQAQVRAGALELLHDDEWTPERPSTPVTPPVADASMPSTVPDLTTGVTSAVEATTREEGHAAPVSPAIS
jgi:hypothetical protein